MLKTMMCWRCFMVLVAAQVYFVLDTQAIENVALGRPASQKSTMRHSNGFVNHAELAVDGITKPANLPEDGCSSTTRYADSDAWWRVDLGNFFFVLNVTVYNRAGSYRRLADFYVRVGNSSDISKHTVCAYHGGYVGRSQSASLVCNKPLVGRYVSIQRTSSREGGFLQLCEVQVYGYLYQVCRQGKFGEGCKKDCNCNGTCNQLDGRCDGVCYSGKQKPDCQTDCRANYFGPDCKKYCYCKGLPPCSRTTGVCPEGCREHFDGPGCTVMLPVLAGTPSVTGKKSNSVTLEFRQFKKGNWGKDSGDEPVGYYWVHARDQKSVLWESKVKVSHDKNKVTQTVTVEGLKSNTVYEFRVVPVYVKDDVTLVGRASESETVTGWTACDRPVQPEINYISVIQEGSNTTLRVFFRELPEDGHRCDRYSRLMIRYKDARGKKWYTRNSTLWNAESILIHGLKTGRTYQVTVTVYNNAGRNNTSAVKEITPQGEETIMVPEGSDVTLNCSRKEDSVTTVSWSLVRDRDRKDIVHDYDFRPKWIIQDKRLSFISETKGLKISGVRYSDNGTYVCTYHVYNTFRSTYVQNEENWILAVYYIERSITTSLPTSTATTELLPNTTASSDGTPHPAKVHPTDNTSLIAIVTVAICVIVGVAVIMVCAFLSIRRRRRLAAKQKEVESDDFMTPKNYDGITIIGEDCDRYYPDIDSIPRSTQRSFTGLQDVAGSY